MEVIMGILILKVLLVFYHMITYGHILVIVYKIQKILVIQATGMWYNNLKDDSNCELQFYIDVFESSILLES